MHRTLLFFSLRRSRIGWAFRLTRPVLVPGSPGTSAAAGFFFLIGFPGGHAQQKTERTKLAAPQFISEVASRPPTDIRPENSDCVGGSPSGPPGSPGGGPGGPPGAPRGPPGPQGGSGGECVFSPLKGAPRGAPGAPGGPLGGPWGPPGAPWGPLRGGPGGNSPPARGGPGGTEGPGGPLRGGPGGNPPARGGLGGSRKFPEGPRGPRGRFFTSGVTPTSKFFHFF